MPTGRLFLFTLARRPLLAGNLLAGVAFLGCALLTWLVPADPYVEDEFSNLLAADTFAHGRLTNPTHPLWVHFETLHVIQQPTYMSKYPPGPPLLLALGQVLTGQAVVGAWLSVALACAAIYGMLYQWLSPRWALLGGLLVVLRLVCFGPTFAGDLVGYWGRSYWGGGLAAAGGALVYGALRAVLRQPRETTSLLLGLGLVILANSRPLEGLIATLPAGVLLLAWLVGPSGPPWRVGLGRVVLPITVTLLLGGAAMGYYHWRVTGHPLRMPYVVHETTYAATPVFLWLPLPDPVAYHHEPIRWVHEVGMRRWYHIGNSPSAFFTTALLKLQVLWGFYLLPGLAVALLGLPWVLRNRWMRLAALPCALILLVVLVQIRPFPHYTAPVTGLVFLLLVQGLRQVRLWRWRGRPLGRSVVRLLPGVMLAAVPLFVWLHQHNERTGRVDLWFRQRAALQAQLEADGQGHLILVYHSKPYEGQPQLVANGANIDGQRVIWARDLGPQRNQALLRYFADRQVWLLDADARPLRLQRGPGTGHASQGAN